jgi:hypothetical protein
MREHKLGGSNSAKPNLKTTFALNQLRYKFNELLLILLNGWGRITCIRGKAVIIQPSSIRRKASVVYKSIQVH